MTDWTTSVCLCTYISNEKRLADLGKVLASLQENVVAPAEIVIVDDKSPMFSQVDELIQTFIKLMHHNHPEIPVSFHPNEVNIKHPKSQNLSWKLATGRVLIHIEDDICVPVKGWNQMFAKVLQDHPEVGQVIPHNSGRGEYIPRPGYREYMWGLGGLFAIRREVFEKIGGWDETLCHQIEPDFNLRVRMGGWRLGDLSTVRMVHLGEGDESDTFERQAMIHIGVYNFLKKWNRRFFGTFSYRDVWCQSFDDFPINVAFRRQLAAYFAAVADAIRRDIDGAPPPENDAEKKIFARAEKEYQDFLRCRMNANPEPFKYPGNWGEYELVKLIRPKGREREDELIYRIKENTIFGDDPELHKNIKELADRFFEQGKMAKQMSQEDVAEFLKGKEQEYNWNYDPTALPMASDSESRLKK